MEKIIWVIENNRIKIVELQHRINAGSGMKATFVLTKEALKKRMEMQSNTLPSLILMGEDMLDCLPMVKQYKPTFATPVFVMSEHPTDAFEDWCYEKGISGVLTWPLSERAMSRIGAQALQFETGRQYERILQRQTHDLETAQEIYRLNQQLEARNELLHHIFGKYFSDEVLEKILEDPKGASIGGEKREVAVLISDLRGFSAQAEMMHPDTLTELLDCYFGKMSEIITSLKGTVIEFMGDGILAVFGAPLYNDTLWENAVVAAIQMQNAMEQVNEYARLLGVEDLSMGIGLHCGETFIGNVGSEKMMRYNVIGRTVNVCSRVESVSVGGQVLISGALMKKIDKELDATLLTKVMAKGMTEEIEIYKVNSIGACCHKCPEEERAFRVLQPVTMVLQKIDGKVIDEEQLQGRLIAVGNNFVIVLAEQIADFTDVKLKGIKEGKVLFDHCYAKAVSHETEGVKLVFTRMSKDFKQFQEDIFIRYTDKCEGAYELLED